MHDDLPATSARRHHALPLLVFLLLTGFYLLTMSGHTYSSDEETMLAVTRGLAAGDVAIDYQPDGLYSALPTGADGRHYSPYGILPSLLAVPLLWLSQLAAPLGPAAQAYALGLAAGAFNAPITAATAALLAHWALRIGVRPAAALALALLYGLATFAWPYARTFFSEPLTGLLIMLAAERAHAAIGTTGQPGSRAGLLCGLACGLLLCTRIAAGVALPVLSVYLLLGMVARRPARAATMLRAGLWWGAGMLPGLLLLAWYNQVRYGTPLASGYASEASQFSTPLATGLAGLLISPGKGVVWYAPPLLLALPGAIMLWRRGHAGLVFLGVGLFLSHLLLYARWVSWTGGGVWGPRLMLPVVAPLLLLAAGVLLRPGRGTGLAVAVLGTLGGIANLGGVLLHPGTYLTQPAPADRFYSLAGTPLVAHWHILAGRWQRALAPGDQCAFGDGWYAPEAASGLPRRSGAIGSLACQTRQPLELRLAIDDARPDGAPASKLHLYVGNQALPAASGERRVYTLRLPAGTTRIDLHTQPWNPAAIGFSTRADDLGTVVVAAVVRPDTGGEQALVDRGVAPLPAQPVPRWAWYYDAGNQHLADVWFWYLPRSELAGPPAWIAGLLIVAAAVACFGAAWWIGR